MFISEVLEDLLDPDKAGDGVRGLEEALGKGSLKKKLIEFSIKGWVGVSGGGQILFKKLKKHAYKIHFRPF